MIDIIDDGDSSLTRGTAFLGIDKVCNLEAECKVRLVILLRIDCILCAKK